MAASDEDLLSEAREAYKLAVDGDSHNRVEALDDLKFARLGEQWPLQIRNARERANRPCLTVNRLPAFIRQVVNDARQNKPSIRVHPVDSGADVLTAKVLDGLIRNIEQSSNADVAYDTAADFAVTIGFGFWRVGVEYAWDDAFEQDITIDRIGNPFAVYGDPYSTAADSSDWNSAFVTDTMTEDAFRAKWKGAETADWDATAYTDAGPQWFDGEMVTVAEWWTREEVERTLLKLSNGEIIAEDEMKAMQDIIDAMGLTVVGQRPSKTHKVVQRIISGAEVLETNPWAGKYIPIVPVYGDEVNVEGKRYFRSLIRDAKDAQRMHNYWRTTAAEMVALAPKAPWIGPEEAFEGVDAAKWDKANVETHSYIAYAGSVAPTRMPPSAPDVGAMQEALAASDDMKAIMGLYDASLGQRSNETSGKAIMARQREGDVSTFHFLDNVSRAIRHTGRILLDLIPKVYTGERIVRVLGEDGTPASVKLGQAAPGQPPAPPPADGMPPTMPPGQQPAGSIPPAPGAAAGLPPGVERIYDLATGKYDLTVQAGPSFTTRRQEAADQMMTLISQYPQAAPVIGDLLVKNLDWPGADEIADRLKAMGPQPHDPNAPPPVDPAKMAELQQRGQVEQQKLQADMMKAQQDAALQLKLAEMETARAIAVAEISAKADIHQNIHTLVADTVQAAMQAETAKTTAAMQPARPAPSSPAP